jgi:hypothetical protein
MLVEARDKGLNDSFTVALFHNDDQWRVRWNDMLGPIFWGCRLGQLVGASAFF